MEPLTPEQRRCRDVLSDVLRPLAADAERWADALIREFGSLPELLVGDAGRLAAVAPAVIVEQVAALAAFRQRALDADALDRITLDTYDEVVEYLRRSLAHAPNEQVRVLYFAPGHRLLATEVVAEGSVDRCPVYPREVIRRALQLNASALVLAHNHPSGRAEPSRADITITRDILDAGRRLEVAVHDHLIVSRTEVVSLRARGLI